MDEHGRQHGARPRWEGEKNGRNPAERGKPGGRRSLLTDARGVPLGLAIDGANRQDMRLAAATLESDPVERPELTAQAPQRLCLDKGYDFAEARAVAAALGLEPHIRARGGRKGGP